MSCPFLNQKHLKQMIVGVLQYIVLMLFTNNSKRADVNESFGKLNFIRAIESLIIPLFVWVHSLFIRRLRACLNLSNNLFMLLFGHNHVKFSNDSSAIL